MSCVAPVSTVPIKMWTASAADEAVDDIRTPESARPGQLAVQGRRPSDPALPDR
jgi:hypothetical protein